MNNNSTSLCSKKQGVVIKGVSEMSNLTAIINVDTYDILTEMEFYRGKISKDIDNVIDY